MLFVLVCGLPAVAEAGHASFRGYAKLRSFLLQAGDESLEQTRTDLAADYASLFLGLSPRPVPPYASVYTNPERLMMQEEHDRVRAEYAAEGVERAEGFREPDDHIAVEFEFMVYLCRQASESLRADDLSRAKQYLEKQRGFLHQHLLNWIPSFLQYLRRAARTDYYKAIADITEEHLEYDKETLDELIAALA